MVAALVALVMSPGVPDVSQRPIPNQPVSGKLNRASFRPDRIELQRLGINKATENGKVVDEAQAFVLRFRTGKDFFADQEITVWFTLDRGQAVDGRVLTVTPVEFGSEAWQRARERQRPGTSVARGISGIHASFKKPGRDMPDTDMHMDKFSARLEFGKRQGSVVPGKIHLRLPDPAGSTLAGTFRATLKG